MRTRASLLATGVAAVLAGGALGGCGSASDSAATTTTAAPSPSPGQAPAGVRQQFKQLRSCLKKHGVELPENPQASGQPPQIDQSALQACQQYLPQGGPRAGVTPPS